MKTAVDHVEATGPVPRGLRLLSGFIATPDQARLMEAIHSGIPRGVGENGRRYYTVEGADAADMPAWAPGLGQQLVDAGVFSTPPDWLHIIKYPAGVGISPHFDDGARFRPVIASLTLGSTRILELTRGRHAVRVFLQPGDLYVLEDQAFRSWLHAVPHRSEDEFGGITRPRAEGVSITWRSMSPTWGERLRWHAAWLRHRSP